ISGSLAAAPSFITYSALNAYNLTYTQSGTISTGPELPPSTAPTFGTLSTLSAPCNITLGANTSFGAASIGSGTVLFLNGKTLTLGGLATSWTNNGSVDGLSTGSSTLLFAGGIAQTSL